MLSIYYLLFIRYFEWSINLESISHDYRSPFGRPTVTWLTL
jgi:hypothetical protein